MLDTSGYDADSIIDRQRQVFRFGTTHIQQATDGLRLARVVGLMSLILLTLSDGFAPKQGTRLSCRLGNSRLRHLFGDFGKGIFVRLFLRFLLHGSQCHAAQINNSSIGITGLGCLRVFGHWEGMILNSTLSGHILRIMTQRLLRLLPRRNKE
jgi:hypothetical protein